MSKRPCQSTLTVQFASPKQASIVQQCLEGDDELQPLRIDKTFQVTDSSLIMYVLNKTSCIMCCSVMKPSDKAEQCS